MRALKISFLVTAAVALMVRCGDGGGGTTPANDLGLSINDTGVNIDAPDVGTPGDVSTAGVKIDFVKEKGHDDKACKGVGHCAFTLTYNAQLDLEVIATRDGKPVEGATIIWTVVAKDATNIKLGSLTSFTGANGMVSVKVQQNTPKTEEFSVTAKLDGSTDPALSFDISVIAKGQVPLSVSYTYKGKRSFQGVLTSLFKQDAKGEPVCDKLADPTNLPTATLQAGPKGITQSTQFLTLPGLEADKQQRYTVVGLGQTDKGQTVVLGCNDDDATVTVQGGAKVIVELKDLPPRWKGKYDVTTQFDLVSALPDNVEPIVNTVLGLFTDPAGQLMVLACQYGGTVSVLSDLCGYVFVDPAKPCLEDTCYKTIGIAAKNLIKGALESLLKDNIGGTILFTGKDIANILKELELVSTFEFKKEPAVDGTFKVADTEEEWHTVRYRWTLGSGCDPTDKKCGWHAINLGAVQDNTIIANFSGKVDYSKGPYMLHIDKHSINVKYGKLAKYIIEKEILPRIAGDGSDGLPKIDTFEELVKSLLGGKACLKKDTCCDDFAAGISASGGFTSDIAKAACSALIPLAADQLGKFLEGLDVQTGDSFTIATEATGCTCEDQDSNLSIDAWGTPGKPCKWDTTLKISTYTQQIKNDFWGTKQQ